MAGWTYEERCTLKKLYNEIPLEELAIILNKDKKSIYNQVYYLRKRGWKFNRNGETGTDY
jgi:hypothetical protein